MEARTEGKTDEATTDGKTAEASAESRAAQSLTTIAEQEGFLETSDPALQDSADRREAMLLSYRQV